MSSSGRSSATEKDKVKISNVIIVSGISIIIEKSCKCETWFITYVPEICFSNACALDIFKTLTDFLEKTIFASQ